MTSAPRIRRRQVDAAGSWPDSMPPLLRRIHAGRGATDIHQAQPKLSQLLPPDSLGGLAEACTLLADAIAGNKHIVVVGDFDCAIRTSKTRA